MLKSLSAALTFALLAACAAPEDLTSVQTPSVQTDLDTAKSPGTVKPETAPASKDTKPVRIEGSAATDAERAACEAAGGEIMRAGLSGAETCIQPYEDAGKACMDSSECLGKCYVVGEYPGIGEATTAGQCQPTSSPFGCRTKVTGGKAGGMLCVD